MSGHTEFLPAAQEIHAAAPPPAVRALLHALVLLCVVAAGWSWLSFVDIVAVAEGKVLPADRVKVIQPLEAGVVRAIHVREGDRVAAGAVLIELDGTESGAQAAQVQEQILALRLERARLRALLDAVHGAEEESPVPHVPGATSAQAWVQQQRVRAELQAHRARMLALAGERSRRVSERAAAGVRLRQLEDTVPLITERAAAQQRLLQRRLLPRAQWLELEEQRIAQTAQRDLERHAVVMHGAAIAALDQERSALAAGFERDRLAELDAAEMRLVTLEQESVKAGQRLAQQALKAPVAGIVQRLSVQTLGGVVTPAQALMQIVPEPADLEIEAWFRNQDVASLGAGQPVVVKIGAFPFTRHGTLAGTLLGIAPDALDDGQHGLRYAAHVELARTWFNVDGRRAALLPGMAATVEVNLGRRRVAEYLLGPLLRYRDEALRER